MQFSYAFIAAAALAVVNAVQITNTPSTFQGVTAGRALNITWTGATGPVTLTLMNGEANALETVSIIAAGQTGTSYAWAIPSTLDDDTYAIRIDDATGVPNYSVQFAISGGAALSSPASPTGSPTPTGYPSTTPTPFSNSTSTRTSSGPSGTRTPGPPSGSNTPSAPPNTNSAASFASPLAFVLLAFAALMTLN